MATVEERFRGKVNILGPIVRPGMTPCWVWTASTRGNGYGQFWDGKKCGPAHRASWEIFFGPIPDGQDVLHKCDTRLCVNPEHLFLGTHLDNMQDMVSKGRWAHGETCGRSKRSAATIRAIRDLHAAGISQADLARNYGVTTGYINQVVKRRIWAHV